MCLKHELKENNQLADHCVYVRKYVECLKVCTIYYTVLAVSTVIASRMMSPHTLY